MEMGSEGGLLWLRGSVSRCSSVAWKAFDEETTYMSGIMMGRRGLDRRVQAQPIIRVVVEEEERYGTIFLGKYKSDSGNEDNADVLAR